MSYISIDKLFKLVPTSFAIAELAKQPIAMEIGGQFCKHTQQLQATSLSGRRAVARLKHFDQRNRPLLDFDRVQGNQEAGWVRCPLVRATRVRWKGAPTTVCDSLS